MTGEPAMEKRWFLPPDGPHLVLWWVPAGHIPSPDEAKKKLEFLATHGPTAEAFTFSPAFPHPEENKTAT